MTIQNTPHRPSYFVILAAAVLGLASDAQGQLIRADLDTGFVRTSSIVMTVDEMLGAQKERKPGEPIVGPGYPALRIAEVQFKPVRYVRMEVTDPKTGATNLELVWYLIYRYIPRDYTELAGDSRDDLLTKLKDPSVQPNNDIDSPAGYPLLIPRFVLRTDDEGPKTEYVDEVNLQIQRHVFAREFQQRSAELQLFNSIDGITEIIEPVSVDDPDALDKAVYGVAVWRNVDPETDYFTISMSGFSNAYRISVDPAGETVVEQKVIEQQFGRPGDKYDQNEMEFRVVGDPTWHYRPRPAKITVPNFDAILRNVSSVQLDDEAGN